jgi:hypothetical protein
MPIINAFSTVQDMAYISVPTSPIHDSQGVDMRLIWPKDTKTFIVNSFSIKEISTLDFDTSVVKGSPTGSMWSIGDTVWKVDFSTPFLVWDPKYFADYGVSYSQIPAFANMPVLSGCAYPARQFVTAAKQFLLGSERSNRGLWSEHWAGSMPSTPDFLVQKVSIEITDDRSMLSVSLLSTTDPRSYFDVMQIPMTVSPGPLRVAKPWDFHIPNDVQVLGSPITNYYGGYSTPPTRYAVTGYPHNISFVLEWSIGIESQITRFRSVGTPSGRPMLGITSQQSTGRIKYLPLHVSNAASATIVNQGYPSESLPTGWRTDSQSMEMIERYGGQLFVSGHPNYQQDGYRPVFPELRMKLNDVQLVNIPGPPPRRMFVDVPLQPYYIVTREMFGPVGAASVGFEAVAGGSNAVVVDYKTLLGETDAEAEFFTSLTGS